MPSESGAVLPDVGRRVPYGESRVQTLQMSGGDPSDTSRTAVRYGDMVEGDDFGLPDGCESFMGTPSDPPAPITFPQRPYLEDDKR